MTRPSIFTPKPPSPFEGIIREYIAAGGSVARLPPAEGPESPRQRRKFVSLEQAEAELGDLWHPSAPPDVTAAEVEAEASTRDRALVEAIQTLDDREWLVLDRLTDGDSVGSVAATVGVDPRSVLRINQRVLQKLREAPTN